MKATPATDEQVDKFETERLSYAANPNIVGVILTYAEFDSLIARIRADAVRLAKRRAREKANA
jgi:hypothetical protein